MSSNIKNKAVKEVTDYYPRKKRTICQVHRELYHIIKNSEVSDKDYILGLISEVYNYGKRMNDKLVEYSEKYKK
jgi:hypothetical protein